VELFWHDYETFGIDPRRDRPSQFAGVRTDENLNVIDEPQMVYCKPSLDYLPQPEACLITGISPLAAEGRGLLESEFICKILEQIAKPGTCTLGYNSIRFDDEFTRNCLYRNFYDPYAREWQNGNCRWDIIDVVRATKALRPDGITWPVDVEGRSSFRLELLTKANGLTHESAHDALSDVYATIALARLIKQVQPRLYQFLWQNKGKQEANALLQLGSFTPLVHVSGRYASAKNCLAVVLPLFRHPTNSNGVVVYDLSFDPEALLSLDATTIRQRLFTATADLPEGIERIPLKTVHANKCPVLAPLQVLRQDDQQRLQLDMDACYRHLEQIKRNWQGLQEKLVEVHAQPEQAEKPEDDPDLMIYSGGFFPDRDKYKMQAIPKMNADQLSDYSPGFIDRRLDEMLFRYRARNFPETLDANDKQRWREFCVNRLNNQEYGITLAAYKSEIALLRQQHADKAGLLDELEQFADQKHAKLAAMQAR
jgi:exodeoxyribonuclease I